jgi:hypothetical protein
MFLYTIVHDWRIDGGRRVPDKTDGNFYYLNTNRMYEITQRWDDKCQMRFFDDPSNSRDGGAWMTITDETILNVITWADSDIGSKDVTFDVFKDNDHTLATTEITLQKSAIAYCYPFGHNGNSDYTWVVYADAGWNMIRILVDHTFSVVFDLLEEHAPK